MFLFLAVCVFRQIHGELYLHGQMEETVVELPKVKMPGLIRLNTTAVGVGGMMMYGFIRIWFCSLVSGR